MSPEHTTRLALVGAAMRGALVVTNLLLLVAVAAALFLIARMSLEIDGLRRDLAGRYPSFSQSSTLPRSEPVFQTPPTRAFRAPLDEAPSPLYRPDGRERSESWPLQTPFDR